MMARSLGADLSVAMLAEPNVCRDVALVPTVQLAFQDSHFSPEVTQLATCRLEQFARSLEWAQYISHRMQQHNAVGSEKQIKHWLCCCPVCSRVSPCKDLKESNKNRIVSNDHPYASCTAEPPCLHKQRETHSCHTMLLSEQLPQSNSFGLSIEQGVYPAQDMIQKLEQSALAGYVLNG